MKCMLLSAACAVLLTPSIVDAVACTQTQLASLSTLASNAEFTADCGSMLGTTSSTTAIDASALAGLNPCGNDKCLAFLKTFAATLPACELAGYSLEASFDVVFSLCNGTTVSLPTGQPREEVPSGNSTESSSTTTTTTTTPITRPPTSGAAPVKEADTPSLSKTSSGPNSVVSDGFVALPLLTLGFAVLLT